MLIIIFTIINFIITIIVIKIVASDSYFIITVIVNIREEDKLYVSFTNIIEGHIIID